MLAAALLTILLGSSTASHLTATLAAPKTPCDPPADDTSFLAPSYHVVLTVKGSQIHCADAAGNSTQARTVTCESPAYEQVACD